MFSKEEKRYLCEKNMILVVDCGATKSEWLLADSCSVVSSVVTDGFNPNITAHDAISAIICNAINALPSICDADRIFFYGSGCGNDANRLIIKSVLKPMFTKSEVFVYPDTLATCHALFADKAGVACILGTGSNACLYDGSHIVRNANSLGFMIGDEGSGCHIGKIIARDYFYGIMPEDLRRDFLADYNIDRDSFLRNVYHNGSPSKYLSSFTLFAKEHLAHHYIQNVVGQCFDEFIERMVMPLSAGLPLGFVGSVAYGFSEILSEKVSEHGLTISKVLKNPAEELVRFYQRSLF